MQILIMTWCRGRAGRKRQSFDDFITFRKSKGSLGERVKGKVNGKAAGLSTCQAVANNFCQSWIVIMKIKCCTDMRRKRMESVFESRVVGANMFVGRIQKRNALFAR